MFLEKREMAYKMLGCVVGWEMCKREVCVCVCVGVCVCVCVLVYTYDCVDDRPCVRLCAWGLPNTTLRKIFTLTPFFFNNQSFALSLLHIFLFLRPTL